MTAANQFCYRTLHSATVEPGLQAHKNSREIIYPSTADMNRVHTQEGAVDTFDIPWALQIQLTSSIVDCCKQFALKTDNQVSEQRYTEKPPNGSRTTISSRNTYSGKPLQNFIFQLFSCSPILYSTFVDFCFGKEFSDLAVIGREGCPRTQSSSSNGLLNTEKQSSDFTELGAPPMHRPCTTSHEPKTTWSIKWSIKWSMYTGDQACFPH